VRDDSFPEHLQLLDAFLTHRLDVVERIQALLNAQRKPVEYQQDGSLLFRVFEDCFFIRTGITVALSRLRGDLEDAHRASGFAPRKMPGLHNGLADPAEMMMRAFYLWRQTRWPGRSGRIRFAQTLFNLYVIRCLELLSMRVWDDDKSSAADRLASIQRVLDRLWTNGTTDQPLVKDARWLIQLAQSPATDDLGAYFDVTERVARALPDGDRLEIHRAGVRMTAGHLRSQTRYYAMKTGVPFDDPAVTLNTRSSNALDFALLVQELVPLLEAYEHADGETRIDLADSICQAISPDPDLFLNRIDLLGPYTMIQHVFIATDEGGNAVYTPRGLRHTRLLDEYRERIGRITTRLVEDCARFRPLPGGYSPYGLLYGFSSHLLEHIVLKSVQADDGTDFSLENVFVAGGGDKLAWVTGWRKLPHIAPDVEKLFEYPQQFAEDVFARLEAAVRQRVSGDGASVARTGRLVVIPADTPGDDAPTVALVELSGGYIQSSDLQLVNDRLAEFAEQARLTNDRQEGRSLLSHDTPGGMVAIGKAVLTDVLGTGRDTKVCGLPPSAVQVLKLMCPELAVVGANVPS
jgi:hypothetical protein